MKRKCLWSSCITQGAAVVTAASCSVKTAFPEPLSWHEQKSAKFLDTFQDMSRVLHYSGHVMMCEKAPKCEIKN